MQENPPVTTPSDEPKEFQSRLTRLTRSPLAWLFVLLSVAYLPIFWGDIIFFRDPAHWNYPARAFVRNAILQGQIPQWNPFVGLGVPVWANPLYAVLYPPNWLLLLVPERLVASAVTWQSAAHTLWGGLGLYFLARQFRCRPVACLIAALAWSLSGYTSSMWSAGLLLISGSWLPWVGVGMLSATRDLLAGRSYNKAIPKVALPIAMVLLAGEVFIAMMSVGFAFATVFAWWFGQHEKQSSPTEELSSLRPSKMHILALLCVGIALGVLVGAVVIEPARTLVSGTSRAKGVELEEAEVYSFHPLRVLEMVAPFAMGTPSVDYPGSRYVGEKRIDGMPLALSSYFGASVFGLALMAFGKKRHTSLILLCLCFVVLFVCFGKHTPVHSWWRAVALPFKYMRYPEKYVVVLVGWFSLLAGLGFDRLVEDHAFKGRRVWGLALVILIAFVSAGFAFDRDLAPHVKAGAATGFITTISLGAVLWLRKRKLEVYLPLSVVVVALELSAHVWRIQPFSSPAATQRIPMMASRILSEATVPLLPPRLYRSQKVADTVLSRVDAQLKLDLDPEILWILTLTPNIGSVFGISTVPGYDAATHGALDEFWSTGLEFRATLLRLLAVEFALLPIKDPQSVDTRTSVFEPIMDPVSGARLYRVKDTLPRVYVAGASRVLNDKDTLYNLFTPEVASGGLALVATDQGHRPMTGPSMRSGSCKVYSYGHTNIKATCDATNSGMAVFVEQFAPGWSATLDGTPVKLLRVNHVMRGVQLDRGVHRIEMKYQTPGGWLSSVVSGFSICLIFAMLGLGLFKAHQNRQRPVTIRSSFEAC